MLKGKKGLILGLANDKSIAFAVAKKFVEEGAEVIGSYLNDKSKSFIEPHTKDLGIQLMKCNIEHEGDLENFVKTGSDQFKNIDFIVHSIAFANAEDLHGRMTDSSAEGFKQAIEVSAHSFAKFAKLAEPFMKQGGSAITMTYIGSEKVVPNYQLMGPVKATLESITRYMASELGENNIRVHAISPGPIATRAASGIKEFDQMLEQAKIKSPLKRTVTTTEVANLAAFLCSDQSSGMTGQTIYVDAGCHIVA